jgi:hypothetical protein
MKGASSRDRGPCRCLLAPLDLHSKSGVSDSGLVLLGEVKLAMLLEPGAGKVRSQGLEGRPILRELLRDTALGAGVLVYNSVSHL